MISTIKPDQLWGMREERSLRAPCVFDSHGDRHASTRRVKIQ
jgi:hypothetical protein